ncbi:MAG: VacB/RNase II family 3'-5' exoribonuclease [Cyanothece sp. SIO1E1]|nr:VacB/RNase II family 3'-5' exoribonuclease [Cyanothece sp. SIO1E1]
MEFSIAALLANFTEDKLIAPKVLEKKLDCQDQLSLRKLQIALDALEKIGILIKERGKYRRIPEESVVEGKLRCSSKGFCFAIQDIEGSEDIYIRESQLNTAWNGDRVLVKVTKESSRKRSPEGEVRLILERANSSLLARVKEEGGNYQAVPLDDRLLFELNLEANGGTLADAVDQLVHVEVSRYPLATEPPLGKVAQILGSDAEAASDIDIVCCKHDLPKNFPEPVLAALKTLPTKVRKTDLRKRVDLRSLLTVTIDGPIGRAVDDAFSLERTKAGDWRLGVHVSDVSYYVDPDSALDREAQKRGNSVHLGSTNLSMLPEYLTVNLCSLLPGQERLAISILLTLDDLGQVLEFEIQPTVIQTDYHLNYQESQAILERSNPDVLASLNINAQDLKALAPTFELLDQLFILSQALRAQRLKRGAFELNLPENALPDDEGSELGQYFAEKFHYDDEGALGAVVVSSRSPARMLVTELMLVANQLVASHLRALGVPAIYRVHRTPDPEDVQELMKLASNMGIDLHLASEEVVRSSDYQRFTQQFASSKAEKVLTYLLLSTLKPAAYSTHPSTHFGLALEQSYTHFADPLRRYPDLLVHRILHAIFDEGRDRRSTRAKDRVNLRHSSCHGQINWNVLPPNIHSELEEYLAAIMVHLNEREKLSQEAELDLEGLKKAEFMQAHTGEVFQGLITGVQSYGFFVELEDLLVEGLVHVSSLKDDWYEYRSRQQKLVGRKNRKQYRLGDRVEVEVKSVDYYRQQIDLVAVGGGSEAPEDEEDSSDSASTLEAEDGNEQQEPSAEAYDE